jgi:mannose-1-phosphate guanylyltransferase
MDPTASISGDCLIGPNVVIGKGAVVKPGARIKNSVILDDAIINNHSYIDGSIVGWRSKVGKWARIENLTLLGEDVVISDEVHLSGTIVLPNVPVKTSYSGGVILF